MSTDFMDNKALLIPLLAAALLVGCSSPQRTVSEELARTGFVAERVVGIQLKEERRLTPERTLIARTLGLIARAQPPRTSGWRDPVSLYTLELSTGSSFETQRLTVQTTAEGDGWFQKGGGKRVSFFSPELGAIVAKQPVRKPNKY
jgi:hypothetical protein